MKWSDEKLEQLIDGYEYMNLEELSNQIGCTVKAITRKAEKLGLFRAKNNDIVDGLKFCTFCNTYHEISHFYVDRAQSSNFRYNCKKYYEKYKLKNIRKESLPTTTLLNQKRGNASNRGSFETSTKEKIKYRPRNPVVIKDEVAGKVCNGCKVWKPLSEYGNDKKGIAGKRARCRFCLNSSK